MITDKERLEADEYEIQYYGFSSSQFYVDVCFQYEKTLQETIKAAESALLDQSDETLSSLGYNENMLRQRARELHRAVMEKAKEPMVKLKEECSKIFAIPKNVLLEEDRDKSKKYADEDISQLKLDIEKLEEELIKEQILLSKRRCLKKMIEDTVTPMYDKVNDILSTSCEKATNENNKISNEDGRQLNDKLLLDEIQCTVNYKLKGYKFLKGTPLYKTDVNH